MVTLTSYSASHADSAIPFFGRATDPKPGCYGSKFSPPPNGSTFRELNGAFREWVYDADERRWNPLGDGDSDYVYPFTGMERKEPYFYEIWYDRIDYDEAEAWYRSHGDLPIGGCSGIRKGNFFGRNLDLTYDNRAEFLVHTPRRDGLYASIGIAGGFSELTEAAVREGKTHQAYSILPFQLYDGMNEHRLTVSTNVVPTDYGENIAYPQKENLVTISSRMMIRYLLDHFSTAKAAVEFMRDHMTIHFSQEFHAMHFETHWMIADRKETYIVEVIENRVNILDVSDRAYMTNFYLTGIRRNPDGSLATPETGNPKLQNGITDHGAGLERWNIITAAYDALQSREDMEALLQNLRYSRAYGDADPVWYSEFVDGDIHIDSPIETLKDAYEIAKWAYQHRSRDTGYTWHTLHSAVYDLLSGTVSVRVQEGSTIYTFR